MESFKNPRRSSGRLDRIAGLHWDLEAVSIIEALCLAGCEVARPITDPKEYKFGIQLNTAMPPELNQIYGAGFAVPDPVYALGEKGMRRFLEFFSDHIRNKHTRRSYARAIGDFISFCECDSLAAVTPDHVLKY